MRVMLMIKGDPEPGAAPSEELMTAMGRYNDELQKAGVLLDQAQRAVTFRTRDDVREALRRYSNGRLQLDPDED